MNAMVQEAIRNLEANPLNQVQARLESQNVAALYRIAEQLERLNDNLEGLIRLDPGPPTLRVVDMDR